MRIARKAAKLLLVLFLTSIAYALLANPMIKVHADYTPESQLYVQNFINDGPLGNWTYMEKPFFPVFLNASQIPVGENYSIVVPLQAGHEYHAYLYGEWLTESVNRTQYDMYIYGPNGTMEGYHTADPLNLGSNPNQPFFIPEQTGNYTFTISNDAGDSNGAGQATFMIMENVETNTWYDCQIEGKDSNGLPQYETSWAYEFMTNSSLVEVEVNVPDSLDMYEARLFLMANNASAGYMTLGGVPLAWEPGLYGNMMGNIGGYDTDSQGYQGIAYATCDNFGQDMLINLNGPSGESLYYLVFIGDVGTGNISFLVKTSFNQGLSPVGNPDSVFPGDSANITYVSNSTDLVSAALYYSVDDWETNDTLTMAILPDNRTCKATIPPQEPSSQVCYIVEATDVLGEILVANGTYSVGQAEVTVLTKPMFPVYFNENQIAIGREWSVICPLEANDSYHVYFYGQWVNTGSEPTTDYDIYVYDPNGQMVGYHTPSSGIPPNLGNSVSDPFFVPELTGNYTFVISNSPFASKGAQEATFMIIEDVQCNVWNQCYLEGMNSQYTQSLDTSWAYEFVTDSPQVNVYVNVPDTLDMYEARLYLMTDPTSNNQTLLGGVPLAWEPGLYGNMTQGDPVVGGYNLETTGYRGVAWASCEFYGQEMQLNFTSPTNQITLYQLVFIGEVGNGTIQFLIKTDFNESSLVPSLIPSMVYPGNNATVTYVSTLANLQNATLQYSIDNWASINTTTMEISNGTCTAIIPGQEAGTTVQYSVTAVDALENALAINGSYTVKYPSTLNFTSIPTGAKPGDNVTITGVLAPSAKDMFVTIYFVSANETEETVCTTLDDGTFSGSFRFDTTGTWMVYANFNGTATEYESSTSMVTVQVEETLLARFLLYIFGGIGAVATVGIVFYVRKMRT